MEGETTIYSHGGVEITFNAGSASFTATIAGKRQRASSLSAMKARIDKAAGAMEPFDGLVWRHGALSRVRIVGVTSGRKWKASLWVDDAGREHAYVHPASEIAALTQYAAMCKVHREEKQKMDDRERAAFGAIPRLTPKGGAA